MKQMFAFALPLLALVSACSTVAPDGKTETAEFRAPAAASTKLRKVFRLPAALERAYGDADVEFRDSSKIVVRYSPYRASKVVHHGGKAGPTFIPSSGSMQGSFTIAAPFPGGKIVMTEEIAAAFLEHFYDRLYPWQVRNEIAAKVRDRVVAYGADKLVGREPKSDEIAALWWKLRLEGSERKAGPLREGDKVIIAIRTFGYKGSSFTPADFGHSTMGVRTVGGNPDNDYILNPGAKVLDPNFKASMADAIRGSDKIPNKLGTLNLWDWLESQRKDRYLDIDIRILPISAEQEKGYQLLRREFEKVQWGEFLMLSNNCANGALDLYNTVLPFDDFLKVRFYGPIVIPEDVLEAASKRFHEAGGLVLTSPSPPDGTDTPDVPAKILANRRGAEVFKAYIEAERAALRR